MWRIVKHRSDRRDSLLFAIQRVLSVFVDVEYSSVMRVRECVRKKRLLTRCSDILSTTATSNGNISVYQWQTSNPGPSKKEHHANGNTETKTLLTEPLAVRTHPQEDGLGNRSKTFNTDTSTRRWSPCRRT
jgi:hypothetical protein